MHAVRAAVPIFIATTMSLASRPPFFFSSSSFLYLLSSDYSSPAPLSLLQLYCRSRAARKHNYAGFLFPRLFLRPAADVGIPATTAARYRCCLLRPRGLFSVKVCKVIREYEFGRSCFTTRALVLSLRICQILTAQYSANNTNFNVA